MKKLNIKNKKILLPSKKGIAATLIFTAFCLGVLLLCHFLCWDGGKTWAEDKFKWSLWNSYMVLVFHNLKCFIVYVPVFVVCVLAPMGFIIRFNAGSNGRLLKKFIKIIFFIFLVVMLVLWVAYYVSQNPTCAFWAYLCLAGTVCLGTQWITLSLDCCDECGYVGLKLVSSSKSTYTTTQTYGGKYENVKSEIKDDSNNTVGYIESRQYVPEKSYTTTHTRVNSTYECPNCEKKYYR